MQFREAVEKTGRNKLIMTALWTEACLTFPALDALREGNEVYVPVDAVGGTSLAAHDGALRRIEQAGGKMISVPQLFCELQRDWKRAETVPLHGPVHHDRRHRRVAVFAGQVVTASRLVRNDVTGQHHRCDWMERHYLVASLL